MKLKMHTQVVPWRTPEQFKKVYECLYSDEIINKRWAVDQISVWETRCHPALPTAIEATVVLVRAVIQDLLFAEDKSFCQEQDIRMLYAMAIVRFVNLIVEIDQNAQTKIRMTVLAEKKNIPKWVVDLRNAATHSNCPSLSVLQMAAVDNLHYLKKTFWEKEVQNICPLMYHPTGEGEKMLVTIQNYRRIQHMRIERRIDKKTLQNDSRSIMREIIMYLRKYGKKFVDVLMQPGAFINLDDVTKVIKDKDSVFLDQEEVVCLPLILERMWAPLLRQLHLSNLIPDFLELLLLQNLEIKACQKVKAAWAMRILDSTSSRRNPGTSPVYSCFTGKKPMFNIYRLFYACVIGANQYTHPVLNRIMLRINQAELFGDLLRLTAIYQGLTVTESSKAHSLVYSAENMEEDLEFEERKRKRKLDDHNVWSLTPLGLDFSKIPLGDVLHPVNLTKESETNDAPQMDDNLIKIEDEVEDMPSIENVKVNEKMQGVTVPDHFVMPYIKRHKKK